MIAQRIWKKAINRPQEQNNLLLLYLLVRTHAVIGQFRGPYSPVRPAKICFVLYRQLFLTFIANKNLKLFFL